MQIQLKQLEIESALKMYIAQQGINLVGKVVEMVFTSGRKDNGLSVELTIEDAPNVERRVLIDSFPPSERVKSVTEAGNVTEGESPAPAIGDPAASSDYPSAPVKAASLFN